MQRSWKTTTLGAITILSSICDLASAVLTGHYTAVNWPTTLAAITSGVGLICARDNDKTSEEVGAK